MEYQSEYVQFYEDRSAEGIKTSGQTFLDTLTQFRVFGLCPSS